MHSSQAQTTVIPLSPDSTNLHYSAYKPFRKLLPGSKASPTAGYIFHSSYPCSTGVLRFLGFTLKHCYFSFSRLLRLPTQDLLKVIFRLLPQSFRFILHDIFSFVSKKWKSRFFFPLLLLRLFPWAPVVHSLSHVYPLQRLPQQQQQHDFKQNEDFVPKKRLNPIDWFSPWTHHSLLVLYFTWTLSLGNN